MALVVLIVLAFAYDVPVLVCCNVLGRQCCSLLVQRHMCSRLRHSCCAEFSAWSLHTCCCFCRQNSKMPSSIYVCVTLWAMAYCHSSGQEAPVMIAAKRQLFSFFSFLTFMLLSTGSGCDCCAGLSHQHRGRLHSDITHAQHVPAPHRPC